MTLGKWSENHTELLREFLNGFNVNFTIPEDIFHFLKLTYSKHVHGMKYYFLEIEVGRNFSS